MAVAWEKSDEFKHLFLRLLWKHTAGSTYHLKKRYSSTLVQWLKFWSLRQLGHFGLKKKFLELTHGLKWKKHSIMQLKRTLFKKRSILFIYLFLEKRKMGYFRPSCSNFCKHPQRIPTIPILYWKSGMLAECYIHKTSFELFRITSMMAIISIISVIVFTIDCYQSVETCFGWLQWIMWNQA